MSNNHINLIAYDHFEKLENFGDRIDEYRQSKLDSAKGHVNFIKNYFSGKQISVLELGSGNSKTLFALEKAGILRKGYGIEISKFRFEFAQLWKKEWDFKRVENINANVIDINFEDFEDFDLCFCVDLAFQFLEPIEEGKAFEILKNINKKLRGGGIILELDGCDRILSRIRNGNVKLWEEFSLPDPWRYSLWDCTYDSENKFLKWKKIFIKRNEFGFSDSSVILRVYKKDEICSLLENAGFKKVELYADWEGTDFKDDTFEYIVVGSK